MIIGVSGRIGSGKDLVGRIIQYLTLNPSEFSITNKDILADMQHNWYVANKSNYQIKKFADKLKDIVCLLTGCTREQLEDSEFKNRELSEEWWYYRISKDIILPRGYYPNEEDNQMCEQRYLYKPTYRSLLQQIGTDLFRNQLHSNIWCNTLFNDWYGDIEIWKYVKSYEKEYQVSSFGRVKRKARVSKYGDTLGQYHTYEDLILKQTKSGNYLTVKLLNKQTYTVHKLVAEAFINKVAGKNYINHIDQNPLNNFYKNLEWCTQSENIISANKNGNGNIGEKQSSSILNEGKVIKIKELLKTNILQKDIAIQFGVKGNTISAIKKGKQWKHVGLLKEPIKSIKPEKAPNWIITDTRFPNELKAIKDRGGITIRVSRNNNPCVCIDDSSLDCLVKCNKKPQHESEKALDNAIFDYEIDNSGTIEELIGKIKEILVKEKII